MIYGTPYPDSAVCDSCEGGGMMTTCANCEDLICDRCDGKSCARCGRCYCSTHAYLIDAEGCEECVLEREAQEPPCTCVQVAPDMVNIRGCEAHDPHSPQNRRTVPTPTLALSDADCPF